MRWKFALLILLQVMLLVGIIGYRHYWVTAHEKILLRPVAVDPRDIFRGDYVTLNYDFSTIYLDKIGAQDKFQRNDTIYAVIQKRDNGIYQVTSVYKQKPTQGKFIRGRVTYAYDKANRKKITVEDKNGNKLVFETPWLGYKPGEQVLLCLNVDGQINMSYKVSENVKCREGQDSLVGMVRAVETITFRQINAEYGIEHYFVEEGKGKIIETARRDSDLKVEVALRPDGQGLITALYLDGKRF